MCEFQSSAVVRAVAASRLFALPRSPRHKVSSARRRLRVLPASVLALLLGCSAAWGAAPANAASGAVDATTYSSVALSHAWLPPVEPVRVGLSTPFALTSTTTSSFVCAPPGSSTAKLIPCPRRAATGGEAATPDLKPWWAVSALFAVTVVAALIDGVGAGTANDR